VPTITARVKPQAREGRVERGPDGVYRIHVRAPAEGGRANQEACARLAEHFGCVQAAVVLRSGGASRSKRFQIGPEP
jgi:uncharacterized protein YggU (UPF0235/DUF167 family)